MLPRCCHCPVMTRLVLLLTPVHLLSWTQMHLEMVRVEISEINPLPFSIDVPFHVKNHRLVITKQVLPHCNVLWKCKAVSVIATGSDQQAILHATALAVVRSAKLSASLHDAHSFAAVSVIQTGRGISLFVSKDIAAFGNAFQAILHSTALAVVTSASKILCQSV